MTQAILTVHTNADAELSILDAALNRISRTVGPFKGPLDTGLYKIKVNRGGAIREQLIELGSDGKEFGLYITDFPAIAPIASMLPDQHAVEALAQKALRRFEHRRLLILGRWPAVGESPSRPFDGMRLYPWRATRDAIDLGKKCRDAARIGDEQWAVVAIPLEAHGDTLVLEMRRGNFVSRQAVPISKAWETRIFLRGLGDAATGDGRVTGAPCDVSIQMAKPGQPVVYWDHLETVEVARRALENGRNIFTSQRLIDELLHGKFDNPITGITGLHLLLDGFGAGVDLAKDHPQRALVDEVLQNLTHLLQPNRPRDKLLYADPAWSELPDMTALRMRAGRAVRQVEVTEPPLFKASWDSIKAHAYTGGLSWIGRQLWSETGDANRLGPYLAWVPRQHSAQRTIDRIVSQQAGITGSADDFRPHADNRSFAPSAPASDGILPTLPRDQSDALTELALAYQLPLSILEPRMKPAADATASTEARPPLPAA